MPTLNYPFCKEIFLIPNLNLPWCNLRLLPCILSLGFLALQPSVWKCAFLELTILSFLGACVKIRGFRFKGEQEKPQNYTCGHFLMPPALHTCSRMERLRRDLPARSTSRHNTFVQYFWVPAAAKQ